MFSVVSISGFLVQCPLPLPPMCKALVPIPLPRPCPIDIFKFVQLGLHGIAPPPLHPGPVQICSLGARIVRKQALGMRLKCHLVHANTRSRNLLSNEVSTFKFTRNIFLNYIAFVFSLPQYMCFKV